MAAILIIEDDGLIAGQMARTLRQAGHTPILAPDAHSALQEAAELPDIILLDLGLPDLPGEEVLQHLKSQPQTAQIPVLIITGKRDVADRLWKTEKPGVVDILLKPVSGVRLREAVGTALAVQGEPDATTLRLLQQRRAELIVCLVEHGSDPLVLHISRRLLADRVRGQGKTHVDALSWTEIANCGMREGLLSPEEASLLRHVPLTRAGKTKEFWA